MTFWKRENYGDSKRSFVNRASGRKRGRLTDGLEEIFRAVKLLGMIQQ